MREPNKLCLSTNPFLDGMNESSACLAVFACMQMCAQLSVPVHGPVPVSRCNHVLILPPSIYLFLAS